MPKPGRLILFTSGTGVSKGCELPHRSSIRAAESMIEAFALRQMMPFTLHTLCSIACGDRLSCCMDGWRTRYLRKGSAVAIFGQT